MAKKISLAKESYRPLNVWMTGQNFYLKSFRFFEHEVHVPESIFVALDEVFPAEDAAQVPLITLDESWCRTKEYVTNACDILNREGAGHALNGDESDKVIASIGQPPQPAFPLYLISTSDDHNETIVYIGRTNSNTHRFAGGHHALTKLLAPRFDGLKKRLYLATVTVYTDEDRYIPLDWLHPPGLRDQIWEDVEAQLVYHFQPELNTALKGSDNSRLPLPLTFHNYTGTKIVDGEHIFPHRDVGKSEWYSLTN